MISFSKRNIGYIRMEIKLTKRKSRFKKPGLLNRPVIERSLIVEFTSKKGRRFTLILDQEQMRAIKNYKQQNEGSSVFILIGLFFEEVLKDSTADLTPEEMAEVSVAVERELRATKTEIGQLNFSTNRIAGQQRFRSEVSLVQEEKGHESRRTEEVFYEIHENDKRDAVDINEKFQEAIGHFRALHKAWTDVAELKAEIYQLESYSEVLRELAKEEYGVDIEASDLFDIDGSKEGGVITVTFKDVDDVERKVMFSKKKHQSNGRLSQVA